MATTRLPKAGGAETRVKELKAQLDKDPFNINVRLMLASALDTAGRTAESVKLLLETVDKARRNLGVAHSTLAKQLMKAKKPDEALKHFDTAIEVDPTNATFYLSLKAAALKEIGLEDKAKALYNQLLMRKDLAKQTRRIVLDNLGE